MAFNYSPNIVTDELILYLDTANPKSIISGATTWGDLSQSGNNASIYGGVPFVNNPINYFDFTTVTGAGAGSASLGFTFSSNMIPTTGNFTINTWVKNPPTSVSQSGLFSNAGGGDGYRFGVGKNGVYWLIGPTYAEGTINFLSTLNSTSWYNINAIYARSETTPQIRVYVNGILQGSANFPSLQTTFQNGAPGIVRSSCCLPLFTGYISQFSAYSKALSQDEIIQNYNTTKSRFEL